MVVLLFSRMSRFAGKAHRLKVLRDEKLLSRLAVNPFRPGALHFLPGFDVAL
jgi:hypothetical protein